MNYTCTMYSTCTPMKQNATDILCGSSVNASYGYQFQTQVTTHSLRIIAQVRFIKYVTRQPNRHYNQRRRLAKRQVQYQRNSLRITQRQHLVQLQRNNQVYRQRINQLHRHQNNIRINHVQLQVQHQRNNQLLHLVKRLRLNRLKNQR